ncbi:MAG: DUF933 domain-containing protein [Candidatus Eisenbacteria bacterium]|nr:DUF933 domain-containing protein [Candidatus Eisenbacteria bacterium]
MKDPMRLGIVGLRGSGKTTLFKILSSGKEGKSLGPSWHLATIEVPDDRLDTLGKLHEGKKLVRIHLDFVDGLALGESKPLSPGSEASFFDSLDGLIVVIRSFRDELLDGEQRSPDPKRDLDSILTYFLLYDLELLERRLAQIEKQRKVGKTENPREEEVVRNCLKELEAGHRLRDLHFSGDTEKMLRSFRLLSMFPMLTVLNMGDEEVPPLEPGGNLNCARIYGKTELEILALPENERGDFIIELGVGELHREKVLKACLAALNQITFFTIGKNEVRAWSLRKDGTALDAADAVHTDMVRGFIKAEVISFDELVKWKTLPAAREKGILRLEGRDYPVKDGDVIYIKFST